MRFQKNFLLFICIASLAMACEKNDVVSEGLEGNWIEASLRQDTIQFEAGSASFILRRGKELQNGFLLPKSGAGLYNYYTKSDSIFVRSYLSSNSNYQVFSFAQTSNGTSFVVGNFFLDGTPRRSTLRFERMP